MVNPELMCDQHLLGEHVELHMLVKNISIGRSIKGYLNGLVDPNLVAERHEQLVKEINRRGMRHNSSLENPTTAFLNYSVQTISEMVNLKELASRCERCSLLINNELKI